MRARLSIAFLLIAVLTLTAQAYARELLSLIDVEEVQHKYAPEVPIGSINRELQLYVDAANELTRNYNAGEVIQERDWKSLRDRLEQWHRSGRSNRLESYLYGLVDGRVDAIGRRALEERASGKARARADADRVSTSSSPTLKDIDDNYPGLAEQGMGLDGTFKVGKFVSCADMSRSIKGLKVTRVELAVHMKGQLRGQDFTIDFVDTGQALRVTAASLGSTRADREFAAGVILGKIESAAIVECGGEESGPPALEPTVNRKE
jgi:hypothetical protein